MQISHIWMDQVAMASQIITSMQCRTACIPQPVFRHSHWPRLRTRCAVPALHETPRRHLQTCAVSEQWRAP